MEGREDKEWHEEEEPQSGTSGTGDLSKEFTGILMHLLGCLWHDKKKKGTPCINRDSTCLGNVAVFDISYPAAGKTDKPVLAKTHGLVRQGPS